MQTVTHSEFASMFPAYYRAGESVFLHGNIGIGKSDLARESARQQAGRAGREFVEWTDLSIEERRAIVDNPGDSFVFVDIRLAENEPTDLRGLPDFDDAGHTEWKAPLWVAAACQSGAAGVVFLDEANLAPDLVQKVAFKLVHKGEIGQRSFSEDVFVMAAGNTTEDEARIRELPGPLRDRFAHLRLKHPEGGPKGSWVEWASDADIDPRVIGFIASDIGRQHLYTFDGNEDAVAFATPRSWERVSAIIEAAEGEEAASHREELVGSLVGPGPAAQFSSFLSEREKFDVGPYIDDPAKAEELNEGAFDESYAALSAIAAAYGRGEADLNTVLDISDVVKTEYAAYLLTLSKQHSDEPADTFNDNLGAEIDAGDYDLHDVFRVMA